MTTRMTTRYMTSLGSRFQESDDEYDIHEAAWKNGVIKRQWAETTVTGLRNPGEDEQ